MDIIVVNRNLIKVELDRIETDELGITSPKSKKVAILNTRKAVTRIIAELKATPIIPLGTIEFNVEVISVPTGGIRLLIRLKKSNSAIEIFTFENSDDMITGALILGNDDSSYKSTLYYDGKYHLCLFQYPYPNLMIINEFAKKDNFPETTFPLLQEHATLLIDETAIQTMAYFFQI